MPSSNLTAKRTQTPSISEAFELYKKTSDFRAYAPATQSSWDYLGQYIRSNIKIAKATANDMDTILRPLEGRVGLYRRARGVLNRLFEYAVENGWRDDCPRHKCRAKALGSIARADATEVLDAMTRPDIPEETRVAIALIYFTAQRLVDVVKIKPSHRCIIVDKDGRKHVGFRVEQQKTGVKVEIAIHPDLESLLPNVPHDCCYVGGMFIAKSEKQIRDQYERWKKRRPDAPSFTLHGGRKAASCEAAEAGATIPELMAYLGHKSAKTAAIYFEQADKSKLAANAIARRFG